MRSHTGTGTHDFPPSFSYEGLSILLCRTVGTLQADKCRKPDSLPPCCTPPGTRQPLWLLEDVLAWLSEHRETPAPRRPGRPHKTRKPSPSGRLDVQTKEVRHGR